MISKMSDIILIALELEAPKMSQWDNVFFTGVGKVNAAMTAAKLIERHKPNVVWNFGTAGGITVDGGIHEVTQFVQRDMSCAGLGYSLGQTPFEDGVVLGEGEGLTCSTGDDFVADPNLDIPADLVEMEAYAIAKVCKDAGVEFRCYKYVSDQADDGAAEEWSKTVANGESHFIEVYSNSI
jgi:adenosylhomocysteine nucleosidase